MTAHTQIVRSACALAVLSAAALLQPVHAGLLGGGGGGLGGGLGSHGIDIGGSAAGRIDLDRPALPRGDKEVQKAGDASRGAKEVGQAGAARTDTLKQSAAERAARLRERADDRVDAARGAAVTGAGAARDTARDAADVNSVSVGVGATTAVNGSAQASRTDRSINAGASADGSVRR